MTPPPATVAEPISPVYLVTGEAEPAAPAAGVPAQGVVIGSVAFAAAVVVIAAVQHRRRLAARMDPADLAMRTLARRLRLRRADRAALRALAAAGIAGWPTPLHPVALLVSRHAFEAAAAAAHLCCPESVTARIDRIRWRAFGDSAPRSPATQPV